MSEIPNLRRKLEKADPDVRAYVKHVEATNRKLQAQIVRFQSQHFTDKNRIAALEKELKKGTVRVTIKRFTDQTDVSEQEG
jgi:hypothetical protein